MPTAVMLAETPDYWETFHNLLAASGVSGPRIHDARIAALCRHHGGAELWTADRDFGRFGGLRFKNPLLPAG